MTISVIIPYCCCSSSEGTANLERCLESLSNQTLKPDQIIICDDSEPANRNKVIQTCYESEGVHYIPLPFISYKPQFAKKFNEGFRCVIGDKILILCSNWILEPNILEEMSRTLAVVGKGNMIASDAARKVMGNEKGEQYDWFAGYPNFFELTHGDGKRLVMPWDYVDEGFLNMLWKDDWLSWDEEFDQVGAWHAVVEWGYRLIKNGLRLWIRRDLNAFHQERSPRPEWIDQTHESDKLLRRKIQ